MVAWKDGRSASLSNIAASAGRAGQGPGARRGLGFQRTGDAVHPGGLQRNDGGGAFPGRPAQFPVPHRHALQQPKRAAEAGQRPGRQQRIGANQGVQEGQQQRGFGQHRAIRQHQRRHPPDRAEGQHGGLRIAQGGLDLAHPRQQPGLAQGDADRPRIGRAGGIEQLHRATVARRRAPV